MRKILLILLALTMIVASLSLVACGKDTGDTTPTDGNNADDNNNENEGNTDADAKVDYTVKVVDGEGNGVAGVPVDLYVGPSPTPVSLYTDHNGVATHKMKETNLPIYAALGTLPEGYGDGDEIEVDFAPGAKTATITVVKQIAYSVSFVDANGKGISGVRAQVCVGDICLSGKTTGETGKLIFYVNPGSESVSMQINEIPVGFAQTLVGTKQYYAADTYEIEVTLDEAA